MKATFKSLLCAAIMLCAAQTASADGRRGAKPAKAEQTTERAAMYFSSKYVVTYFYYGEKEPVEGNLYFIVYDDADAGMENEVLQVEAKTFQAIAHGDEYGKTVVGRLWQTKSDPKIWSLWSSK